MNTDAKVAPTVKATLNFAADRSNGGIWSNFEPSRTTQKLTQQEVPLTDARTLPEGPSVKEQGFAVRRAPVGNADWSDADWITQVYIPQCMELVREVSGADYVTPMQNDVLIRDTGNPDKSPAAEFVHLDNSRESLPMIAEFVVDAEIREKYPRVMVFNIWRPLTPPPQDVPLALCEPRTLNSEDWVIGVTIEPEFPDGFPYVSSIYNPDQRWWWVSDLEPDEAVVFKGYDSDPDAPFGCLHGAFRHPNCPPDATPRASAEARIFAFFEE